MRDRATGVYSLLHGVSVSSTASGGVYPITAGTQSSDRVIDLAVFPGAYDVTTMRWTTISDDGSRTYGHATGDPFGFGIHHAGMCTAF